MSNSTVLDPRGAVEYQRELEKSNAELRAELERMRKAAVYYRDLATKYRTAAVNAGGAINHALKHGEKPAGL